MNFDFFNFFLLQTSFGFANVASALPLFSASQAQLLIQSIVKMAEATTTLASHVGFLVRSQVANVSRSEVGGAFCP
jgi:hypothetical protein